MFTETRMHDDDLNIVIIDDNQDEMPILKEAFSDVCIPVHLEWITSGRKAIAAFMQEPSLETPDVILIDYRLAGMNGLEVIAVLSRNCRLAHIPVMIMSGSVDKALTESCTTSGLVAAIEKPTNYAGFLSLATSLGLLVAKAKMEPSTRSMTAQAASRRTG